MPEERGDRLGEAIRDWLDKAKRSTGDAARISRRQVELLQVDWDLMRRRADLGERFLRLVDAGEFPGWARDPRLVELADQVRILERRRRAMKDEVDEIRRRPRDG